MLSKLMPAAFAVALAVLMGGTVAQADDRAPNAPTDSKLRIKPAVLTTTADQATPIQEVQWRRYSRRNWYDNRFRNDGSYPYYRYNYRPYSYYRPYYNSYSYYRPYYGSYYSYYRPYYRSYSYPRYYTGYRGGYGPRIGASFYW